MTRGMLFLGWYIISLVLFCWAQLVFLGPWTKPLGPRWQTATLTGHGVWAHMLFVALSLRAVCPKKDAASWGPRFGTFPSDPSLKAWTAAGEIRKERTQTDTHRLSNTTGQGRSGSDWTGLLSEASSDRTQFVQTPPSKTRSPCLDPYVRGSPATGGPCLLSELLTPHGCFILGSRLNRMHLKNWPVFT